MLCPRIGGRDVYEATGRACPQLRRFRLRTREFCFAADRYSDGEALGVDAMHGLRTLALYGSDVTNDELAAVLDGCPHLESLHLSECFNIVADDALRARCAGIKSLIFGKRSARLLNLFTMGRPCSSAAVGSHCRRLLHQLLHHGSIVYVNTDLIYVSVNTTLTTSQSKSALAANRYVIDIGSYIDSCIVADSVLYLE